MAYKSSYRWIAAASTAGLLLAACGSTNKAASSSTSNPPSSGTAVSPSGAPTGSPIKIEGLFDLSNTNGIYTKWANALRASVAGVNARGGINGHKFEVVICDTKADPNASAACGRDAVANHVIGMVSFTGTGNYEPYVIPAHIADFNILIAPQTYTASNSFSIFGGGLAGSSGLAAMGKPANCKKIAEMSTLTIPSERSAQQSGFQKTAQSLGMQTANSVYPVQGSPDMSPFVADVLNEGVDCVALQAAGADEVALIKALYQASSSIKIITAVPFLTGNETALGNLMSRLYIQDVADEPSDTSVPAVRQWVSDINNYSPSPKATDSDSSIVWAQGQLLAYAAKHVSDPTAANVENFLNHLTSYDPGVEPTVNFTKPYQTSLGTRIFSPTMRIVVWKNGAYYDSGPFLNVFTGEPWNG